MILREELYFEITAEGAREDVTRLANALLSGVLDDFFEFSEDFLVYDDESTDENLVRLIITNDEYGIEIRKLNTDDFLDVLCPQAKSLDLNGHLYDVEDEEFRFVSLKGDSDWTDADNVSSFNDELHEQAREESEYEDEE